MNRRAIWGALIGCLIVLGTFLAPFVVLPFGVRLSYFDLALGAFADGAWSASRIGTLAVLLVDVTAIVALVAYLLSRKARPNNTVDTDARESSARGSP